jgi:hypothetical protein
MTSSAQLLTRRDLITRAATVALVTVTAPSLPMAVAESKEPEVTATEDLMREYGVSYQ